ncbi:MAG: hypothetical protein ACI87Q_000853 [Pseudohongiellaceae bacterium]|jgi:hypothetical protein
MTGHNNEYKDYIESLYLDFPTMLTWQHSITGEELRTGFCVESHWLPDIRRLLESLALLTQINSIDPPLFSDFKAKRGYLSIHYDGGDEMADKLIEILEEKVNR